MAPRLLRSEVAGDPASGMKPTTSHGKDATISSTAASKTTHCQNLTLRDWMTVFQYIDAHSGLPQGCVVQYFKTKPDALEFTQATLSRELKDRQQLEQ